MFFKIKIALVTLLIFTGSISCSPPKAIEDCAEYAKFGIPGQDGDILCHEGELLAHSPKKKTPIWVIQRLTKEKMQKKHDIKRKDFEFKPDPQLKKGKRAELGDYQGSGYDRGHMAPAADMEWNKKAMQECFYLSNMAPQIGKGMNRGIWKSLEKKIRVWGMKRGELYVFTGPIYIGGKIKTIGLNEVAVPDYFYKIAFDPQRIEACAFIMPNKHLQSNVVSRYLVSIREIEEKTGLNFLSNLDNETQNKIEKVKLEKMWQ